MRRDDLFDALKYLDTQIAVPRSYIEDRFVWYEPKIRFPVDQPKKIDSLPMQGLILIVGYDFEDSFLLAHLLGFKEFLHVDHYRKMISHRNSSVYITERGRDRQDFGAIEGLFIQGGHTVIDMME